MAIMSDQDMVCSHPRGWAGVIAHRVGVTNQSDIRYDGDMVSANAILTEEANDEVHNFLNSAQSLFNSEKELLIGARDDLIAFSLIANSTE